MNFKKVFNYQFFFITILILTSSFSVHKYLCMIKNIFRVSHCGTFSSLLKYNINKNKINRNNYFFSFIHELQFSRLVNIETTPKYNTLHIANNKKKSQSYRILKRVMNDQTDNTNNPSIDKKRVYPNSKLENHDKKIRADNESQGKGEKEENVCKAESVTKNNDLKIHYRTDYKPSEFEIKNTNLNIDIHDDFTRVKSVLSIIYSKYNVGSDLIFDGVNLKIEELAVDNLKLVEGKHYKYDNEFLIIYSSFLPKDNFTFYSDVIIHPETNYALIGLYKSKDVIVSQCESSGFRHITFYIDRPDIMSKYDVTLTADQTKYPVLLSNGNKVDDSEELSGRHTVRFVDPFPKPCYLFAVVAGDLKYISEIYTTKFSKKKVELYVYSEEKYVSKLKWSLECLKKAMEFDENYFGLEYDLDRLNLVAVSDFNVGAMENKGLNIFNANSLLASKKNSVDYSYERVLTVVGHEYFHNYTGNRVTLRDWFQLILKEGLTVHRENLFSEFSTKTETFRINQINLLRSVQFLEDDSPVSHPIRPESYITMENFYTNTVYNKGSEVMRMYHIILGEEYYKKGISMYLTKNDGKTATCEDFNEAMAEAYKLKNGDENANLDQFLIWYSQSGTPRVTASYSYNEDKKEFFITFTQMTKPSDNQKEKKPLFIPIKLGLIDPSTGKELIPETLLEFNSEKKTFHFKNIDVKPIPSIFRGFSAPVHIEDNLTDKEHILLLKYDKDAFVRYNSCLNIYIKQILANYNELLQAQNSKNPNPELTPINENFISAIRYLLEDPKFDPGFKARIISLPDDLYLLSFIPKVDTDILYNTKNYMYEQIGKKLNDIYFKTFISIKSQANDTTYFDDETNVSFDQINLRKLSNTLLSLLSKTNYPEIVDHISEHSCSLYPSNWLGSFSASAYHDIYYELYEKTYNLSKHDELLLQEWVKTASRSDRYDIYDIIKRLEKDVLKDSKNPNLIRAIYLPFSFNLKNYNDLSGKGYKLLADAIIRVDSFNPQVSTQLCYSFTLWNKLDLKRQELILKEINKILEIPDISKNLKEYLLRLSNKI